MIKPWHSVFISSKSTGGKIEMFGVVRGCALLPKSVEIPQFSSVVVAAMCGRCVNKFKTAAKWNQIGMRYNGIETALQ